MKITIHVRTVPHPDPQRAIDLIANLVLENVLDMDKQKN